MYDVITMGSGTIDCFVDTGNKLFHTLVRKYGEIVAVPFGTKISVERMDFYTGGGGTNTAVAFSRLGFKVACIGKFGGDQAKLVFEELKKEKVDTSFIADAPDVGYSIVLDAKGKDRTILTHKGSNSLLRLDEVDLKRLNTKWLYFASMTGISYDTMIKIAQYASKRGIKIAFNPSSYIALQGYKAHKKMLDCVDILTLNKEEAWELLGKEYSIEETLKHLKHFVKDTVVVTDGKIGAHCYRDKYYFIPSMSGEPVETTGAGDAFGSTFVAGVMMGKDIPECLRMAQANAESAIMYYGAKNILLRYDQIKKAIKKKRWKVIEKDIG